MEVVVEEEAEEFSDHGCSFGGFLKQRAESYGFG